MLEIRRRGGDGGRADPGPGASPTENITDDPPPVGTIRPAAGTGTAGLLPTPGHAAADEEPVKRRAAGPGTGGQPTTSGEAGTATEAPGDGRLLKTGGQD